MPPGRFTPSRGASICCRHLAGSVRQSQPAVNPRGTDHHPERLRGTSYDRPQRLRDTTRLHEEHQTPWKPERPASDMAPRLVVVLSASHGVTQCPEDPQDHTDHAQDHPDRPNDGDLGDEPNNQKNDSENNHDDSLSITWSSHALLSSGPRCRNRLLHLELQHGKEAQARADTCAVEGCHVATIRSVSDAVADNNLDNLPTCSLASPA